MSEFHVRETPDESSESPRVKPVPEKTKIQGSFLYTPSDDGTDENLLVLLHGLGDTEVPFWKLGKSLKLPQTAVLALRAPEQVPFLYEDAFQWYTSFDPLGELIAHPNPTPALEYLSKIVNYLIAECSWPASRIHFFGFAQGGSVAAEFGLKWWKSRPSSPSSSSKTSEAASSLGFGSITTISGPLLSYPTLSADLLCPTPVLLVHRSPPSESALPPDSFKSFSRAYRNVTEAKLGAKPAGIMPASTQEWEPIMRFWSQHLSKRQMGGLYEVLSGSS